MTDQTVPRVHWSFWIICGLALFWNAAGAMNFMMQMNPETLAQMPESHREIAQMRPLWASAAFAVSVFGGVLGCVLLLFRRSLAYPVFILSLLGTFNAMAHALIFAGAADRFGLFEIALAIVMPVLLSVFLVWYSKMAIGRHWLR